MMVNKITLMNKCNKIADMYLDIATQFKSLAKSIKRTTDKKELILLNNIIGSKLDILEKNFNELKGGNK